jgi:rubrerythrin
MTRVAIEPTTDLTEAVEDPRLIEFLATGANASGEFRCADCGYGAVVQRVLPACPMCRGTVWEQREPREAPLPT